MNIQMTKDTQHFVTLRSHWRQHFTSRV